MYIFVLPHSFSYDQCSTGQKSIWYPVLLHIRPLRISVAEKERCLTRRSSIIIIITYKPTIHSDASAFAFVSKNYPETISRDPPTPRVNN